MALHEEIPSNDHVLRYVRKRLLLRDGDGEVLGILPQALELRGSDNGALSVTWIEFYDHDYETGLLDAANAMRDSLTIKPNDGFTVGNVGTLHALSEAEGVRVRVLHEPELPTNPGHAAIRGLQRAEQSLLDILASEAFADTRKSSDIS